jgi:hypothetical protein
VLQVSIFNPVLADESPQDFIESRNRKNQSSEGKPMSLSKFPKQIEAKLHSNVKSVPWTRSVAVGTLVTSGILLATGRRKAALAVAATGATIALLEDPDGVRSFWNEVPNYVKAGQRLLGRFEGLIEQVAEQGEHLKDILRRA